MCAHPEIPKTATLSLGGHGNHLEILKMYHRLLGASPRDSEGKVRLGPQHRDVNHTGDPNVQPGLRTGRKDTAGKWRSKGTCAST